MHRSFVHSSVLYAFMHSFTRSFIIHSHIHHSFFHLFISSFLYVFILAFIYSSMHSFFISHPFLQYFNRRFIYSLLHDVVISLIWTWYRPTACMQFILLSQELINGASTFPYIIISDIKQIQFPKKLKKVICLKLSKSQRNGSSISDVTDDQYLSKQSQPHLSGFKVNTGTASFKLHDNVFNEYKTVCLCWCYRWCRVGCLNNSWWLIWGVSESNVLVELHHDYSIKIMSSLTLVLLVV